MAPGERAGSARLSHFERLTAHPERMHIFHAMRIIEAAYADAPRMGKSRRPREDPVRFGQEAELAFPPSTIAAFKPPKDGVKGRMTQRFFGLFGPQGPLPLHMTEYARARQRNHRDPTLVAFADMFTHRLMTLLYRAWVSGQPAPSFDRGDDDSFERKVAAITGYRGEAASRRDAMPDVAKRHFSGLIAQGPKNAEGLVSILRAYFGADVRLQQFVGTWLDLEPGDRWELGSPAGLGQKTSAGARVWTRNAKFRLRIGPLALADYERLLPGGESFPRLKAIVRNYVGDSLDWDVNLVLRQEDVPKAVVGKSTRLGQISWIGTEDPKKDGDDLLLEPGAHAVADDNEDRDRP